MGQILLKDFKINGLQNFILSREGLPERLKLGRKLIGSTCTIPMFATEPNRGSPMIGRTKGHLALAGGSILWD